MRYLFKCCSNAFEVSLTDTAVAEEKKMTGHFYNNKILDGKKGKIWPVMFVDQSLFRPMFKVLFLINS